MRNEETYVGAKITKVDHGELRCIISDSRNYEGAVNYIGISHERTRGPKELKAEGEQAISRSELGRLIWIARIARQGSIYDDSAAAQKLLGGGHFWGFGATRAGS